MKTKAIEYQYLAGLLVEAIKEQQTQAEQLKAENDTLKDDIKEVKAENSHLKEKLLALGARQDAIEAIVFAGANNQGEKQAKLDDKLKMVK
jgi:cell division protein FtsB